MIFCDTSYLVRLYLEDAGWEAVRELCASDDVAACELALAEIPSALHSACREGRVEPEAFSELLAQFRTDCEAGAFYWQALTPELYLRLQEDYASLPTHCFLRAADALHLACARAHGYASVYSNDLHFLTAAQHFGLRGINIIA